MERPPGAEGAYLAVVKAVRGQGSPVHVGWGPSFAKSLLGPRIGRFPQFSCE